MENTANVLETLLLRVERQYFLYLYFISKSHWGHNFCPRKTITEICTYTVFKRSTNINFYLRNLLFFSYTLAFISANIFSTKEIWGYFVKRLVYCLIFFSMRYHKSRIEYYKWLKRNILANNLFIIVRCIIISRVICNIKCSYEWTGVFE